MNSQPGAIGADDPSQDTGAAPALIKRPGLTMPPQESALIREVYQGAQVILEYGSGGSTVLAAEMTGKTITSVESDQKWAEMMRAWFLANPPAEDSEVDIFWADIGPTKEWGLPVGRESFLQYASYPLEVWLDDGKPAPDVVLIDGRFRPGCAIATALNIKAPVDVYIDDYIDRPNYHAVERWFGAPKMTGRMAYFRVAPMVLDPRDLLKTVEMLIRPN